MKNGAHDWYFAQSALEMSVQACATLVEPPPELLELEQPKNATEATTPDQKTMRFMNPPLFAARRIGDLAHAADAFRGGLAQRAFGQVAGRAVVGRRDARAVLRRVRH